jgi:hypothetical protein
LGASYPFSDEAELRDYFNLWMLNALPKTTITNQELFNFYSYDPDNTLQRYVEIISALTKIEFIGSPEWEVLRKSSLLKLHDVFNVIN